ncbi:hypothetical protein KC332_g12279 [Hortaea werneckii]|nr:hypothetical protein KC358_g10219 [Hortaea werneckii]KAI6836664.1 hypothetical protein KC350_g6239 [Hortaea werneckii]KAI6918287.1 hypothetical protein KC348_g10985 [Hortaea werneckii]KAI6930038.1 hypothetical protein KC341_g10485 [Hortaea werneckii]KAI6958182.1 hypothetical protein KC321_g14150 [Hortaea werneckii]
MGVGARDSTDQEEPKRLIFKLCGSIEHLLINDPQEWLSEFATADNEREGRIARRLALCPETHSLRFHLEEEDCDDTRPFDDLDEAFKLEDFLDRVILLHTAQRATPVSCGNGQPEAIVVDYSGEKVVGHSKQSSEATTKRERDREDERSGTLTTPSKSVDAGPASAQSHATPGTQRPSYAQHRTIADAQKSAKDKPTPAGGSKASKTNDPGKPRKGLTISLKKPHKSENQRREAKFQETQDMLKKEGEARHASRKQSRNDPEGAKLEKDTMLGQKTPVSEGKKSGKERQDVSASDKGKKPMREQGRVGVAPQPTTTPTVKKRKEEKGTSDSEYVNDGESGGQSPKKKPKIEKPSVKSKVGKKARLIT